jgi:EmrB/QacA subfamily drug resistance transporter
MEYKWVVLTVTTIGVLMAGIDSRIVIVGLPRVAAALHADAGQAIWFTQSYVLGTTIALLLIGRITDIVGRTKVYIAGFLIFTLGSALTAFAQDPTQFIMWRALQGLGGAMLFTNSVVMIVDSTPKKELGMSLGINQIAFRFGAMAGLTLSGMILSFFDWRALFYFNIPIGVFGTWWAHRRLKEMGKVESSASIDWIGFVAFSAFITSLLLALTFAAYGMTDSSLVYGLFALSVVSISFFIVHERKQKHPLLDFSLLRVREFTGGVVAQLLNAVAWGAFLLLLSFYFELVLGLDSFQAGLRIIPFDLAFLIFGPLSGRLSDKFGHIAFTTSGLLVSSLALFLFSTVTMTTPFVTVAAFMVMLGAGLGMFVSPNMSSVMGCVAEHRRGIASGFRATFFQIGLAVSLNLAILIMTFVVPFQTITHILTSLDPVQISDVERGLFMQGLSTAYFWLALINLTAIVPSVLRGKTSIEARQPGEKPIEVFGE